MAPTVEDQEEMINGARRYLSGSTNGQPVEFETTEEDDPRSRTTRAVGADLRHRVGGCDIR
jgi:hypothetical protein